MPERKWSADKDTFQFVLRSLTTECLWTLVPKQIACAKARETEPSKNAEIPRELSSDEKINRRRYSYAKRDSSRINVLDSLER